MVVGFGFNGFCQLDVQEKHADAQATRTEATSSDLELATSSPRVLMELAFLPSSVLLSSAWDALHVHVSDGRHSQSVATGRWLYTLKEVEKILQEGDEILEVVETPMGHLILGTRERTLVVVSGEDGSLRVEEWKTLEKVVEMRCPRDGQIFALLASGKVLKCSFDPPDSCKLQLGYELQLGSHRIAHMTCGSDHTLLLTRDSSVLSFGLGTRGQLGHGDILPRTEPQIIQALAGLPMKAIACGNWHCLALSQSGDLYSWGWNEQGQLGLKNPPGPTVALPTLVDVIDDSTASDDAAAGCDVNFVSVGCGSRHSAAVSESGVLHCWGWSEYGQLGDSTLCSGGRFSVQSVHCGHWCTVCVHTTCT